MQVLLFQSKKYGIYFFASIFVPLIDPTYEVNCMKVTVIFHTIISNSLTNYCYRMQKYIGKHDFNFNGKRQL